MSKASKKRQCPTFAPAKRKAREIDILDGSTQVRLATAALKSAQRFAKITEALPDYKEKSVAALFGDNDQVFLDAFEEEAPRLYSICKRIRHVFQRHFDGSDSYDDYAAFMQILCRFEALPDIARLWDEYESECIAEEECECSSNKHEERRIELGTAFLKLLDQSAATQKVLDLLAEPTK